MTEPKRIQRKRTKGWRMPEGAVYVGRPTVLGNPFRVYKCDVCEWWDVIDDNGVTYLVAHTYTHRDLIEPDSTSRLEAVRKAVELFEEDATDWFGGRVANDPDFAKAVESLRGKDLACWCPLDQPCHADVLLRIANA